MLPHSFIGKIQLLLYNKTEDWALVQNATLVGAEVSLG